MKKLIAVLLALSCMLIGAAAVAETLNIAYMPNYGSLWSVETAINKGYFEEEGLTINLVEFADGPTIIAAMESGSIDMGYIGQGAHKLCINGRASIFALSHISNGDALIGGKGITTVEDLKGKVVAYSSGTSSEDILKNSLDKAGMTMDDIKAMDMDASAIVTAMLSGGVDACATWSPNSLKILEEMPDATKLTDNMTFSDTTVSLASWICMPKYGEENHDLLVRFTRALFKGMDYSANEHYDEVSEWVSKQTATDYESVYNQRGDAQWLTGKEVAQGAADGTVAKYYELQRDNFVKAGAVEKDPAPDVSEYVLFDVMIEAGKASNVIPDSADMWGTIRTVDPEQKVSAQIHQRMTEIAQGVATAYRCTAEVTFSDYCPCMVVDKPLAQNALAYMTELLGKGAMDMTSLTGGKPGGGSEDFAFVSHEVPTVSMFLSAGNAKEGYLYGQHHPKVRFDDSVLYEGSAAYTYMALRWLADHKE